MFAIRTANETFSVDADGNIGRPSIGMAPSGKWRALALVRIGAFGRDVEFIPFKEWPNRLEGIDWTFKNGKPRYTIRDLDHGTVRHWGNRVYRVSAM